VTDAERLRLVQRFGMTGSSFDGEALNALRKAEPLIKRAGGWEAVLNGNGTAHELVVARHACRRLLAEIDDLKARLAIAQGAVRRGWWTVPESDDEKIEFAINHAEFCTVWEHGFLDNIAGRHWLTERQQAVLDRIVQKITRQLRLRQTSEPDP
jgi:hypothetical protein